MGTGQSNPCQLRDGRDDGISEGIESVALNLLNMGLTVEKIQEATKLSIERIKELSSCISERR
jgi:predicted transposase YdaD